MYMFTKECIKNDQMTGNKQCLEFMWSIGTLIRNTFANLQYEWECTKCKSISTKIYKTKYDQKFKQKKLYGIAE